MGVELHYLDVPLDELIERARLRTASGEWSASPITRAHFEQWATVFQPPDEEELLLFDPPGTFAPGDGAPSDIDDTDDIERRMW